MVEKTNKSGALGNLKILLAEDNEVNQLLAKGILHFWGLEAKIAVTGFEVLELLEQEDFDLVLMDIQMPGKNGIEAAGEIRRLKNPRKSNIPIIALTANALKGEEKKYKEVGMDDFLTKPFSESDLFEVIERVLRKEGSFERKTENNFIEMDNTVMEVSEKLYDFKLLEEIAAGNTDFLISLAKIFLATIPENSRDMVAAANSGNWDLVSKLAHKLKSTVDSMSIGSVSQDIRTLEMDAKTKVNTEALTKMAVRVDKVLQTVAVQLTAEFGL